MMTYHFCRRHHGVILASASAGDGLPGDQHAEPSRHVQRQQCGRPGQRQGDAHKHGGGLGQTHGQPGVV